MIKATKRFKAMAIYIRPKTTNSIVNDKRFKNALDSFLELMNETFR